MYANEAVHQNGASRADPDSGYRTPRTPTTIGPSLRQQRGHFITTLFGALLINLAFSTAYSQANERCEYPNFFGPVMAPPERQLGEFRVELRLPAYDDRRAVQDHLVNSTVWARFLSSRLAKKTWGGCGGAVSVSFPDLCVFLRRGPPRDGRDSSLNCAAILHDMLKSEPDAGDINRIANDWSPAGIGDFDRNGVSDIVWHEAGTNRIDTWLLAAA
jgi:hypothetical protein